MSTARIHGVQLVGARAEPVAVEARFFASGAEGAERARTEVVLSGLPDPVLRESKGRVLCALEAAGLGLPGGRLVLNLQPAGVRKRGEHLDLALAMAAATACGHLDPRWCDERLFLGELGIDGRLVDVPGGLAAADAARALGLKGLVAPPRTAREARHLPGTRALGAPDLVGVLDGLLHPERQVEQGVVGSADGEDLTELRRERAARGLAAIRGQDAAKHALEVAAAGAHGLLFVGPPGAGKSLLARALADLLPPLAPGERLELTRLASALGEWPDGLVARRPVRAPHHTTSHAGLVGGGNPPTAGEVTRAHLGVLFLDELAEFRREALEALREPLEAGEVHVVRAGHSASLPARFQLVAATNPCPCGYLGHPTRACRDSAGAVRRYRERLSGPVLDRVDLRVAVRPSPAREVAAARALDGEALEAERARVERVDGARARMLARQGELPNARLPAGRLEELAPLAPDGVAWLQRAAERAALSGRAVHALRRVARTLADLAGRDRVEANDLAGALALRGPDP